MLQKQEITKRDFKDLQEKKNYDIFTANQVNSLVSGMKSLIEKGEKEELSGEEQDMIKSLSVEISHLHPYTIVDMQDHRIVKSDVFCMEKQVAFEDTMEKSITGGNIQKGIYLDTKLNRELNRVGETFYKGMKKSDYDDEKYGKKPGEPKGHTEDGKAGRGRPDKEEDDEMEKSEVYKAMMDMVKKGSCSSKKELVKAIAQKYPDADPNALKTYSGKVYKTVSKAYMEKAESYSKEADDEIEEEEKED